MAGTSPFTYQSPSYHSSSYLPKLEANFMRDFSCCGITLPSLHDLLQHYEECHAQQTPQSLQRQSQSGQGGQSSGAPNSKAAIATGAAASVQHQAQQAQQQQSGMPQQDYQNSPAASQASHGTAMGGFQNVRQSQGGSGQGFHKTPLQTVQDMDTVEDMEMDDDLDGSQTETTSPVQQQAQLQQPQQLVFGQRHQRSMQPSVPPLNLSASTLASPLHTHQGLRTSQPTTPASASNSGLPFQNNPTVSSVNTPTLSTHSVQQQQQNAFSPDSSVPGTPVELDPEFLGTLAPDMPMPPNPPLYQSNAAFGYGFGGNNDMLDLCIDEPAKRLFSPNGGFNNQQYAQFQLGGGQAGSDSELARRIREQQMMTGLGGPVAGMMPNEDVKPFRCPVVGCEKAYKNQNGLKYHKTVGVSCSTAGLISC